VAPAAMKNLRGIYSIWLRDIIRWRRDRTRMVTSFAQPALFLFVFGNGLARGLSIGAGRPGLGANYLTFIFPGIIGMSLLFTSVFSAISIVWDREFGFLKEVMVAPISRSSIAIGKAFGGSSVALLQSLVILILGPIVGVYLSLWVVLIVIPFMFLISFSITSMGIVIAARMQTMEGFQMVMNFLVMPLFVLSGAMFPINRLPDWLSFLTRIDPLTYGVDGLRGLMLGPSVAQFSLMLDFGVLVVFGAAMISLAVFLFNRAE
jgi:ABC-2 type transport system permease protein